MSYVYFSPCSIFIKFVLPKETFATWKLMIMVRSEWVYLLKLTSVSPIVVLSV